MMKNRYQIGVMPTILLMVFMATAFVAINFARKPASPERRAALQEQAQPHQATAAWAEQRLADQPGLSNGAAVRLQHEITSRLKQNGIVATPAVPAAQAVPVQAEDVVQAPTMASEPAALRESTSETARPASELWRIAFGSLAALTAIASMLWAGFKRRA
jgi:hypothetical protein